MLSTMGRDDALADTVSFSFFLSNFCTLESPWTGPRTAVVPSQFGYDAPFKDVRLAACYSKLRAKLLAPRLGRAHWESAGRLTGESPLPNWDHAVVFIKHQVGSPLA